jgi:hypothetical protein
MDGCGVGAVVGSVDVRVTQALFHHLLLLSFLFSTVVLSRALGPRAVT